MSDPISRPRPVFRSKVQLLLRDAWRKAYRRMQEGLTLEIRFQTESQAHKARMDLYKAVQPEKHGKGEDLELIQAAQSIEIVLDKQHRNVLIMRDRGQSEIYGALQEALGERLQDVVDPDLMRGAEESLKELERLGVTAEPAEKPIPFYGKRGD